jgi:hypothetical protein
MFKLSVCHKIKTCCSSRYLIFFKYSTYTSSCIAKNLLRITHEQVFTLNMPTCMSLDFITVGWSEWMTSFYTIYETQGIWSCSNTQLIYTYTNTRAHISCTYIYIYIYIYIYTRAIVSYWGAAMAGGGINATRDHNNVRSALRNTNKNPVEGQTVRTKGVECWHTV